MKTELLYKLFSESSGISTDTRTLREGEMFFALSGPSFNGNKFVPQAIQKGAIVAVTDDPEYKNEKSILVSDCLSEMQALASFHREKMRVPVLAITGTNGKTTTKELLTAVLSKKYVVHSTRGNLNNHIGVPLTILSAPPLTSLMIIEMGANHPGEIRQLCSIARPDYGIITNVGSAHLEGFGSFEGVIRTKSELYEYLGSSNGTAIYNDLNPILSGKVKELVQRSVSYSKPSAHKLTIEPVLHSVPLALRARYLEQLYMIRTNLFGTHNLENVKAAVATGLLMGTGMNEIISAVEGYRPGNNRSEIRKTRYNTLICDSYNANPTSMAMALGSFKDIQGVKKAMILGDMLELGEKSEEEHINILKLIGNDRDEEVFLAGPVFSKVAPEFGLKAFSGVFELAEYLRNKPLAGRTILIKGSRGIALERIYDLL